MLGYVVSSKSIHMEDKRIKAIKQWLEPKSVRDIQVFLGFANFYCRFIQGFSRIVISLTLILKTSDTKLAGPKKGVIEVGGDSRARYNGSKIDDEVDGEVDGEVDDKVRKKNWNPFKSKNPSKSKNSIKSKKTELGFLTSGARMAFIELRQAFIKAPILHYFDPAYYIWVETDVSYYAIDGIFSWLTLNNLG